MAKGRWGVIYNTGFQFLHTIADPSQEDIYAMPEYFAMSRDEIVASGCPAFLKTILDQFPWKDRPNVIQVRPQDWRLGRPEVLGDGWHIDDSVRLKDGKVRVASSLEDFRLLVCSFGNVCETDFIQGPLELPSLIGANYGEFFGYVARLNPHYVTPAPNQLVEYTSKDIHKVGARYRLGRFRLMIVAFESDHVIGDGWVLPSLKAKDTNPNEGPQFKDYIT